MALFPKVTFEVLLPGGEITRGSRTSGILVVTADRPIPRAERVYLELVSTARFAHPVVHERVIFRQKKSVALVGGIVTGTYRFPFAFDIPPWLPPTFSDALADIRHAVNARLDVAWAADPETTVQGGVVMRAREGHREPLRTRLPPVFHAHALLEIAIDSTVVVANEPISGTVHLVQGTIEPFRGITLNLLREVTAGATGSWMNVHASLTVPAAMLAHGAPVPFEFAGVPDPTFHSGILDHAVKIGVMAADDFVSLVNAKYQFPIEILPRGSVVHGDPGGSSRLRRRAARVAAETGLREGRGTVIAEGEAHGIRIRLRDLPGVAGPLLDVELEYPDLGLGLELHAPRGLVALREAPALPAGYEAWRLSSDRPIGADFVAALLPPISPSVEVRVSDHLMGFRYRPSDDSVEQLTEEARRAVTQAKRIARAIRALPFPESVSADAARAWIACADATQAFLVPSIPSLSGLAFHRVTRTQEDRVFAVSIHTVRDAEIPHDRVFLYLADARLPEPAIILLANGVFPEGLATLRETFSAIHTTSGGSVLTLERMTWSEDPRALLPAIEHVVDWVMRERGEDVTSGPYR